MKIFTTILIMFFVAFAAFLSIGQEGDRDAHRCLKCHTKDLGFDKKFLHPLVKEGKCRSCHETYDEETHAESVKPDLETCLNCHPENKLGRTHPVGSGVIDQNTGGGMTCTSTCHLPHGSDYKYQLPYKNNMELCLSCHTDF